MCGKFVLNIQIFADKLSVDDNSISKILILTIRHFFAHRPEVILKLVSTASGGTERRVQAGEVFVMTHLDETGHGLCWEADEMQVPCSATHCQVPQL